MFDPVLVGSDLSPASDRVVGCLHGLRSLGTRRIILVHALNIRHLQELRHQLEAEVEPKLRQQKQVLEEQEFDVETVVAPGMASWELHRVAREKQAGMIVVGSHGATLAHDVLLGSVALEVAHRAEMPVFIVQLRITDDAEHGCETPRTDLCKHVLFPTDFSDNAEHAFAYLEQIVRCGRSDVTLLHVQDGSRIRGHLEDKLEEFNRIDRERLERMAKQLKERGAARIRIELPYGLPKQEIVRKLERGEYSLIAMGTQGRGYFGELLLGSIAHHVARRATVPTLLVPPVR